MAGRERKILMPSTSRKPMASVSGGPGQSGGGGGSMCHQIAGLYDLEETLGKGHFAIVKAAKHVFTGERVAVKVIDKTKLDKMSQKALLQEVICMKLVQHSNIIRLYEVIDTSTKMYLVLELGHGDLYDLILKQQGGLGEDLSRRYFSQIVSAVSYCHRLHVVHRDLKPENIVYFPNANGGQVKLTDFGFSNRFLPGIKLETSCGSLAYSAPEILLGDSYDAPAVDIWSMGIILYMLVCGKVPFQEANDSETLTMIMDVKYSIPAHISIPCQHLISSMLIRFPEKRASLDEIQNNIWLHQEEFMEKRVQTPLITDYHLTSDEKNTIVQQMVNGQIGTREEILEAVDKNAYNHVTSTFYLLAEKHVKEHGLELGTERQQSGINSTLTSSLESLHDRRKNSSGHSGPSDTDEFGSGCEEDTLGPLDLEMKNASVSTVQAVKKTFRLHTTHSSSALSDMDKALPILEEDVTAHSEEEDNAGPLLSQRLIHHRRQPMYNHRRVMIPQRSTSCSSSEDEDSEKKKKSNARGGLGKHKHLTKSSNPNATATRSPQPNDCTFREIKKFFDDESSDEHGTSGAVGTNTAGFSRVSLSIQEQRVGGSGSSDHRQQSKDGGGGSGGGGDNPSTMSTAPAKFCQVKIIPVEGGDGDSPCSESPSKRYISLSKSNDYLSDQRHSHFGEDGRGDNDLLGFSTTANGIAQIKDSINCTTTTTGGSSGETQSSLTSNSFNLAKKGKKLFLNWFFFKRGNPTPTTTTHMSTKKSSNDSLSPSNGIPGSSRIYKTKSCSELKIKNINVKQVPTERDVNQNL